MLWLPGVRFQVRVRIPAPAVQGEPLPAEARLARAGLAEAGPDEAVAARAELTEAVPACAELTEAGPACAEPAEAVPACAEPAGPGLEEAVLAVAVLPGRPPAESRRTGDQQQPGAADERD
jgi:hypothetical protein